MDSYMCPGQGTDNAYVTETKVLVNRPKTITYF